MTQLHFSASGDVNDIGVTLSLELDGDGEKQLVVHNQSNVVTVTQSLLI